MMQSPVWTLFVSIQKVFENNFSQGYTMIMTVFEFSIASASERNTHFNAVILVVWVYFSFTVVSTDIPSHTFDYYRNSEN